MKKVVLLCTLGMSTSLLVSKMRKAAKELGIDCSIVAIGEYELKKYEKEADIIMLDNMDIKTLKEAVKLIDNRAEVEASGNVTLDNIREIAETGVDFISTGSVTHSFKVLDISMKNFRYID